MVKIGLVGVRAFSIVDAVKKMPEEAVISAMCDLREEALAAAREKIGLTESQCYRAHELPCAPGDTGASGGQACDVRGDRRRYHG